MSTGSSRWTREQKKRHYDKNPYCHWCGRRMIFLSVEMIKFYKNNPPPLFCTTEHLVNRFDPLRKNLKAIPANKRRVLACKECNEKRGVEDAIKAGIWKPAKPITHLNYRV